MKKNRILIIDDDLLGLESLELFLTDRGYMVDCACTAREGLEKNLAYNPHVVILDVRLPDMDGFDALQKLRNDNQAKNVIIVTAFHDIDTTIRATKLGACEYIPKPIDVEELEEAVDRALKQAATAESDDIMPIDMETPCEKGKIVGKSRAMKEIFKLVGMVSENTVPALIKGETGTGKELIAKAIHDHSPYRNEPFIAINCSAIVGTLLESELFGHEKGSFTGAVAPKKGRFEVAGKGTIFLDEVGEIPIEFQAKFLRFLQEKEFQHVGSVRNLKSDARIISATNRDLGRMVRDGTFRQDLYYRLSVLTIAIPPLRERKSDIPLLVRHCLQKINFDLHTAVRGIEKAGITRLVSHDWPGNIRELENVLIRASMCSRGGIITEPVIGAILDQEERGVEPRLEADDGAVLQEFEKGHIARILRKTNWHFGRACEMLNISRPTLRQKIKDYGIIRPPDVL